MVFNQISWHLVSLNDTEVSRKVIPGVSILNVLFPSAYGAPCSRESILGTLFYHCPHGCASNSRSRALMRMTEKHSRVGRFCPPGNACRKCLGLERQASVPTMREERPLSRLVEKRKMDGTKMVRAFFYDAGSQRFSGLQDYPYQSITGTTESV